jgi:hypothetical protein
MCVTMLISLSTKCITNQSLEVLIHLLFTIKQTIKKEALVNGLASQVALKMKNMLGHVPKIYNILQRMVKK